MSNKYLKTLFHYFVRTFNLAVVMPYFSLPTDTYFVVTDELVWSPQRFLMYLPTSKQLLCSVLAGQNIFLPLFSSFSPKNKVNKRGLQLVSRPVERVYGPKMC